MAAAHGRACRRHGCSRRHPAHARCWWPGRSYGSLTLNPDGSFTYTPISGFAGTDSFSYKANDGFLNSNVATVSITVTAPVNGSFEAGALVAAHPPRHPLRPLSVGRLDGDRQSCGLPEVLPSVPATDGIRMAIFNGANDIYGGTISQTFATIPGATYQLEFDAGIVGQAGLSQRLGVEVGGSLLAQDVTLTTIVGGGATQWTAKSYLFTATSATCTLTFTDKSDALAPPAANGSDLLLDHVRMTLLNSAPVSVDDTYTTNEDTALTVAVPGVLGNDTDIESDPLTVVLVADVAHGTLALAADGSFSYTPQTNFNGSDSFTYKANDGSLDSNVATVSITVHPVNDTPVANDDGSEAIPFLTVAEDSGPSAPVAVLANDSDIDFDTLTVTAASSPNGTVAFPSGLTLVFTPAANFNGATTIGYTISDGQGGNASATVNVTVTAVNDAPVAGADSKTTAEDTALTFPAGDLTANDSPGPANESTQTLAVTAVSSASTQGGTVTLVAGDITYTPAANFNGTDSFTYTVADNGSPTGTATGTVNVTVTAVNDAPVVAADDATTAEDTALTFPASGLTANDSPGPANESTQTLAVTAVSSASAAGGTVTLVAGDITYTPAANFNGADSFTYTVADNGSPAQTTTGTVNVTVTAVNDAPVVAADDATTAEDTALTFPASGLTANDSPGPANESTQTLTVTGVSSASTQGGTVALVAGDITYTPAANFNGADSFTYTVADNGSPAQTTTGTVNITVTAVNDAPVAAADAETTAEDTALTFPAGDLTANDSPGPANESTQTLTVTGVSSASTQGGTVALVAGDITYTPAANFNGADSFTYTVADNGSPAQTTTGTVNVTVTADNDAPVAAADAETTAEDTALTFLASDLTANDSPGPANESTQTLTVTGVSSASTQGGTVALVAGDITYTPAANFNGADSFTYTVADNGSPAQTTTGTVNITVTAVNDAPVAAADAETTAEDTALTFPAGDLTANDSPGPANESTQTLTVTGVSSASTQGGTVALVAGDITYTPAANFNGADSFTYTVADNGSPVGTATGTVNITVTAVNDAPVAVADAETTAEDTALTFPAGDLTANDSPGPANESTQTLTVTGVSSASTQGGTVALVAGDITYTPAANFNGADSFTYTVADNGSPAQTTTGTVNITVTAVNDAPVAAADAETTAEDRALTFPAGDLTANDSPGPANESTQTLTVTGVSSASTQGGTVALVAGDITYTPAANFNGADSFTYTVADNGSPAQTTTGTVNVTVTAVNDAPVAVADSKTTAEDTALTFPAGDLTANDSPGPANESTQTLAVTAVSSASAQGGTVALVAGDITYTPAANFNGTDSFTYTVADNGSPVGTATGTVNITVTAVNDAPVAAADAETTAEDTALTFPASGLTANDSPGPANESAQTLAVTGVSSASAAGGTVALVEGNITYTPSANFNGADSFTYTVADNGSPAGTTTGTVNVTVTAVNDAPVAAADTKTTAEDTALTFPASGLTVNDSPGPANESAQTLAVTGVSSASAQGGTVALVAGDITYTPAANFNGADSFTYTVADNGSPVGTTTGTVNVTVTAVNDAPVAAADAETTAEDTALTFPASGLTANDSPGPANESTQTLTVTGVSSTSAQGGTVALVAGDITYTPAANFNGADSFTYTVADNGSPVGTTTGTVNVTVTAVNDAPVAAADAETTAEDTALTFPASGLTANDSPGPANESTQTLTVTGVSSTSAQGGTVALVAGDITYTPAANFNGADSFTYTVADNGSPAGTTTGTVNVTVTAVNDAPVAAADSKTTAEDTALTFPASGLTANDSPGPANESTQTLAVTGVSSTSAAGGTVALVEGNITYTPAANFNGADSFTYTVADNGSPAGTTTGTVNVTVTAVNDAPVAAADSKTTAEDTALTFPASGLTANDSPGPANESTQTLTVTGVSSASAQGGTVALVGGNITYTPAANFNGADSFTYTVADNGSPAGTTTGTVNVTVTAVNDAPVAGADSKTTAEDTALTFPASGLTANDSPGPANESTQTLTVTGVSSTSAAGGTVALVEGDITYTPAANFNGADSFTYTVADNGSPVGTTTGTVNVTVTAVNDAPVAAADSKTTAEDTALTFLASGLTANDSPGPANESTQTLTVTGVSSASAQGGTVALVGGNITYTPAANFNSADSFTYTVTDNGSPVGTTTGTVNVTVTAVNDAPVAGADSKTTAEDTALTFPASGLTANDSPGPANESTQTLTVTGVSSTSAQGGTVALVGGNITYTPAANFNSADSFTYTVADNGSPVGTTTGTVNVTVTAVNDAPVAGADSKTTAEDTALTFPASGLTANDSPGPANESTQTLTVTGVSSASAQGGTVALVGGNITYTPAANFNGADSFTYTVADNGSPVGTTTGTVNVTVTPVNDAPVAIAQSATVNEDGTVFITLTGSDIDGDSLNYALAGTPAHGTLTRIGAVATYTPDANYHGPDSFTFTVYDGTVSSASATVSITVTPVNDPPVAIAQSAMVNEDGTVGITLTGSDIDGDSLSYSLAGTPVHGSVSLAGAVATYTPEANYSGPDSFTFTVYDGTVSSAPATVSVTVNGGAGNDFTEWLAGYALVARPGADSDHDSVNNAVEYVIGGDPMSRMDVDLLPTVSLVVADPDGNAVNSEYLLFTYRRTDRAKNDPSTTIKVEWGTNLVGPWTNAAGTNQVVMVEENDAFGTGVDREKVYLPRSLAVNGKLFARLGVFIDVAPVNESPVAQNQAVTVNEDASLPVIIGGTDPDGDPLTFAVSVQPLHGTLGGTAPNLIYTPAANYHGPGQFHLHGQ